MGVCLEDVLLHRFPLKSEMGGKGRQGLGDLTIPVFLHCRQVLSSELINNQSPKLPSCNHNQYQLPVCIRKQLGLSNLGLAQVPQNQQ